jgi:hypothetical protein
METLQDQYDHAVQEERKLRVAQLSAIAMVLLLIFGVPRLFEVNSFLLGLCIVAIGFLVVAPLTTRANNKLDEMRQLRLRIDHIHAIGCPDDNLISVVDRKTRVSTGGGGGPWVADIPVVTVVSQTTKCGACNTLTLIKNGEAPRLLESK